MTSIQGRILYGAMKLFYSRIFPPGASIETVRKGTTSSRALEAMPRGSTWEQGRLGNVDGEWIRPSNAAADRVLLYFHGGGYVTKTPAIHRTFIGRLAQAAGIRAFMVDYRLAPEHPFPAALDDAADVYHAVLEQGVTPSKIVLAGDSAGGGLTAALLLRLRDEGVALPAAAGIISGLLDCTLADQALPELQKDDPFLRLQDLELWVRCYYGDHDPRDPLISPVFGALDGLPPLLIQVGEREILLPESLRFAEKAKNAGVEVTLKVWKGMIHAFPVFAAFLPEGRTALDEMGAFFRAHLR
jgi:epsilon-lactone hydrolase